MKNNFKNISRPFGSAAPLGLLAIVAVVGILLTLALTSSTPTALAAEDAAPTALIESPSDLAIVSGTVTVQVDATDVEDAVGTLTVEVSIGGGAFAAAAYNGGSGKYEFSWDTTLAADASYTIDARSSDTGAHTTNATQISVTVDNTPPVITLLGSDPLDVEAGSVYADDGATAGHDNDDRGRRHHDDDSTAWRHHHRGSAGGWHRSGWWQHRGHGDQRS